MHGYGELIAAKLKSTFGHIANKNEGRSDSVFPLVHMSLIWRIENGLKMGKKSGQIFKKYITFYLSAHEC